MESGPEGSDCSLSWPGVLIKARKDGRSCWPQKPNSRVKCQPGVCLSARARWEREVSTTQSSVTSYRRLSTEHISRAEWLLNLRGIPF